AVLLMLGTAISTWQALRAMRAEVSAVRAEEQAREERDKAVAEKRRADDEAASAKAINEFLRNDLVLQGSPWVQGNWTQKPDKNIPLRAVLDRAAQHIEGRFPDRPLVEASIR